MRRLLEKGKRFLKGCRENIMPAPEWVKLERKMASAQRIVDLGCGARPHPRAIVAVDALIEPTQRGMGQGEKINIDTFSREGIRFVHASLDDLPFPDKEFDFAYSHHVFEHLSDPKKACAEACRIARSGVIITPSFFAEIAFGRAYHLWFVIARGNTLIFIRKSPEEDRPFGDVPSIDASGKYIITPQSNPFDLLLNYEGRYRGRDRMTRLGELIRKYWWSHSKVMEVVFLWEGHFDCVVIDHDGSILS